MHTSTSLTPSTFAGHAARKAGGAWPLGEVAVKKCPWQAALTKPKMMKRRSFFNQLVAAFAATVPPWTYAMSKPNIKEFKKEFAYLSDPALRAKETNDAVLTITGAEISGVKFGEGLHWRNVHFVNCDFAGAYEVRAAMTAAKFTDCRFAGIFNFGTLTNVQFLRCKAGGKTGVVGSTESKEVAFVECSFDGASTNTNDWGGFGTWGETSFVRCKFKQARIISETKHTIVDCDFDSVKMGISHDGGGSHVLIDNCRFKGVIDIRPATIQTLTIKNTTFDTIDLTNATVKGDVLIEKVRGKVLRAWVKGAGKNVTIKDSEFAGDGTRSISFASPFAKRLVVDNVKCGATTNKASIDIGQIGDGKDNPPAVAELVQFTNCNFQNFDLSYSNTALLRVMDSKFERLDISNSRIGKLQITGTEIRVQFNATNTQVQEEQIGLPRSGGVLGRTDLLEGSNLKFGQR